MEKLTPKMQARLEKWRNRALPVQSAEKVGGPWLSKSRNVRRDHGDDLSDFEEAWRNKTEWRYNTPKQ